MVHLGSVGASDKVLDSGISTMNILICQLSVCINRRSQIDEKYINDIISLFNAREASEVDQSIASSALENGCSQHAELKAVINRLIDIQRNNSIALRSTRNIAIPNTTLINHRLI